jgi:hypothetical protein
MVLFALAHLYLKLVAHLKLQHQLQKKVDQIEEKRMKDKEEAKKYRDQDKEKIEKLEELVGGMVKKMTAWKQELDVFNKRSKDAKFFSEAARDHTAQVETVGVSDVPPVSDKGVPVQIISYLISVRVSDVLPVSDKGVSKQIIFYLITC